MANVVIPGENGYNNRYGLRRPTAEECIELGWKSVKIGISHEDLYAEKRKWCEENIHWSEYRWDYFTIYFKHECDQLMFVLKWS